MLSFFCRVYFVSVNFCVLLPFPVPWQTQGWATPCAPAQVSPAPPAPSSTRPPPLTPTERSTEERKVPATSKPTGSLAPRKVRFPGSSGSGSAFLQSDFYSPNWGSPTPLGPHTHSSQVPACTSCVRGGTSGGPWSRLFADRFSRSFQQLSALTFWQLSSSRR